MSRPWTLTYAGGIAAVLLMSIYPKSSRMETVTPSSIVNNTGFSYSSELAVVLGLPAEKAMPLKPPLLGAAIEIKAGIAGTACLLHVLYDSNIDIRLPDASEMHALGGNIDTFPAGFLAKPDHRTRQFFAAQIGALSNRAVFRNGRTPLKGGENITQDKKASYTSMPLIGYKREFVPGVGWLSMTVNCELAAHADYSHASLLVESNGGASDLIFNGHVDPAKMIEFVIPQSLIEGMRSRLRAASDEGSGHPPRGFESRFSIFSDADVHEI